MQKPHNNQELFSNYYLEERLPDRDSWQNPEGLEEVYEEISELYEDRKDILEATKEAQTEEEWIKPILHILGFKYIPQPSEAIFDTTKVPDYAFFLNDENKERAYKAAEEDKQELFDFVLAVGDAKRWDLNLNNLRPNKQIDEYLRITDSKWGLLTNGRLWRLYHLDSSYRLDTYYEVDLVDLIEADSSEKFKYFYLFFRPHSFVEEGFLTEVYERSEDYTASVSEDLKKNAFDALQELCKGFLSGNHDLGEEDLDDIYENSLVLLYRLIFLLYAESDEEENLLPMNNDTYKNTYSLQALKEDAVKDTESKDKLLSSSHHYWSHLRDLFSFIDKGQESLGIYEYNGGLFDKERHPFIDEDHSIGDKYLAKAIRKVSYSEAEGGFIDYQDLDVRELGAIYEGLLEHKPFIDGEQVKWEEDLSERKKTGSYYTPEYIVKYIVENTIEPLVEKKKEELQVEIEKLEQKKKGSRGHDREVYEEKLQEKRAEAREKILDLKVLDPAMGSGHFLVEATEKLANEIAALEEEFSPVEDDDEPPVAETEQEDPVKELKRQIVERSIYGVDKNPLATELAKLSLWLHTVAKNEPLSFLDHHLRTGDSLIGIDVEEMKTMPSEREQSAGLFASNLVRDLSNAIGHLNLIEEITSGSRDDVQEKKSEWRDVRSWIDKYKKAANVRLSTTFDNEVSDDEYRKVLQAAANNNMESIKDEIFFHKAQKIAKNKSFFHWELEFPDVFRNQKGKRKTLAGFDVVIGNPPYVKRSNLSGTDITKYYSNNYRTASGNFDLYLLFAEFGSNIINKSGEFGYILPSKFTTTKVGMRLREFVESELNIREFVDFDTYQVFEGATTYTCLLFLNYHNGQVTYKNVNRENPRNIESYQTFKTKVKRNMSGIGWDLKPRTVKLEKFNQKVANIGKLFTGIETGLNEVFVIEKGDQLYDKFIKYEGEIVHKYLKGELVERYYHQGDRLLVITPYDEENELIPEKTLKEDYPDVYKYLLQNEEKLRQREDGKMDGENWYGYVYPKNLNRYNDDRLIWMDIALRPEFCIDREEYWHSRTVASLSPEEESQLEDLEGILNSKLFLWYMNKVSNKVRGGYLRFKPQYVGEFPLAEDYGTKKISELANTIENRKYKKKSLNLNLGDYLGNYSQGKTLGDIYTPCEGLTGSILTKTTENRSGLGISKIEFEARNDKLNMIVSARYKPTNPEKYETDQWGYVETKKKATMTFSVNKETKKLIKQFVLMAVKKANGFANFRKNATKTISLLDRLEALTLPKLEDVETGLKKYLEQKEKAKKLEREIKDTDHQIDAIVFNLYELGEDEVKTVLDSLEIPEDEKTDILRKFKGIK